MRVGIDASNVGGGGGITHLVEMLNYLDLIFTEFTEISEIIVFSSEKVLNQLPNHPKLSKVTFEAFNRGLLSRVIFQLFSFDKEIKSKCDVLLSVTGDYVGNFKPVVGMARNMLLYEREIWKEIGEKKEVFRFWLNYLKQKRSFKNSKGIIFISKYAEAYISKKLDLHNKTLRVINHGISPRFSNQVSIQPKLNDFSFARPFRFLYVSTVHVYKHQWNVVKAISKIRDMGYPVELYLVGGVIFKPAGDRLNEAIESCDPKGEFIHNIGHVPYNGIEDYYKTSNGIIYASTCENMPNTLIESMASGLPIICSSKDPMPEFLKDNGFYFDPYSVDSLVDAITCYLNDPEQRFIKATNALKEVEQYSWRKTSLNTFKLIREIYD